MLPEMGDDAGWARKKREEISISISISIREGERITRKEEAEGTESSF